MIPSQPLKTKSRAESQVFDQLRAAFSGPDQNDWFAMHSLNLPRHEYKRFGEIDFVVCGPKGLFVLEVKGGRVSCHNGIWEITNRYDETEQLRESPFRQADSALHGLLKKLPHSVTNSLVVGYGVVMPNVDRLADSSEWDRAVLAERRDFMQFEKWLERLIRHWRAKHGHKRTSSTERLHTLRQCLRPDFEAVVSLHGSTDDVKTRIARLTEDQLKFIDIVEANSRVICSGGAGTGKTMLALELARRWCASGMRVALACHSLWLKNFLEGSAVPGLIVCLASSIHIAAKRAGIEKFDALIVDEGQDILNMDALAQLDGSLRDGISNGRWCFFHDINNQSGLCGFYEPDAYDYLESFGSTWIPLTTNCRNSRPILERIQGALQADMGSAGVGDGPAVREIHLVDAKDGSDTLEAELRSLIDNEGFRPSDIVVLSPLSFAESWTSFLPTELREVVLVLDDYSARTMSRKNIGFARINDFKGLESEVVVLVDIPVPGHSDTLRSHHYVGMSRACALLSMICY